MIDRLIENAEEGRIMVEYWLERGYDRSDIHRSGETHIEETELLVRLDASEAEQGCLKKGDYGRDIDFHWKGSGAWVFLNLPTCVPPLHMVTSGLDASMPAEVRICANSASAMGLSEWRIRLFIKNEETILISTVQPGFASINRKFWIFNNKHSSSEESLRRSRLLIRNSWPVFPNRE